MTVHIVVVVVGVLVGQNYLELRQLSLDPG